MSLFAFAEAMVEAPLQPQNYYSLLGIDQRASMHDVRQAYRHLARQHHPDLHPDDPSAATMMRQLNEAVDILSDATKRAAYDQAMKYAHDQPQPASATKAPSSHSWTKEGPCDGYNVTYSLTITCAEARHGARRELHFHGPNGHPYSIPILIAPGMCSRTRLLLREMGGPGLHGGRRGDLYIDITITDKQ